MEKQQKPVSPYKSMTSEVIDGKLHIYLTASKVEETIRYAYSLHLSLLPVVHNISVQRKGDGVLCFFEVNTPNHGE